MTSIRLLITAVVVENRPVREVAATYGVSKSWLYELLTRYRREGDAVFEARSRRPSSNPHATAAPLLRPTARRCRGPGRRRCPTRR